LITPRLKPSWPEHFCVIFLIYVLQSPGPLELHELGIRALEGRESIVQHFLSLTRQFLSLFWRGNDAAASAQANELNRGIGLSASSVNHVDDAAAGPGSGPAIVRHVSRARRGLRPVRI
jgi:hypothetical protein